MTQLIKVTGIASVIGGISWAVGCLVHNSLPQGCIEDACPSGQALRGTSPVADALIVVATVMLVVSGAGMLLVVRRAGGGGRTGAVAALVGGLACAFLLAAVVSGLFVEDWSGMPALVVPGVALLTVGAALIGWVVFRSKLLPTWAALVLLGTALLLPLANEQTSRILLAVPFGMAWCLAGVTLVVQSAPTAPRAARPVL
jgi:hypothetical protein